MNEQRLFFWSIGLVIYFITVVTAYSIGHRDGMAERKVCPPPQPVTAWSCAAVWFDGKPGDMANVRARVCPAKKGKS